MISIPVCPECSSDNFNVVDNDANETTKWDFATCNECNTEFQIIFEFTETIR